MFDTSLRDRSPGPTGVSARRVEGASPDRRKVRTREKRRDPAPPRGMRPPRPDAHRAALAAFHVEGLHANDIAALLDSAGICIRSGHHCTQPLHRHYGLSATARASLAFTSTFEEIDRFAEELQSTIGFLREHS